MTRDTGKREEVIKNRFVEYLRKTEGLNWATTSQDVPTRNGRKNFDYLLEADDRGLALEITTRNDDQESLSHNSLSILVWNELLALVGVDRLGGCIWMQTPSSYSMSTSKVKAILKTQGRELAESIEKASRTLVVGQRTSVSTKLGSFVLKKIEGQPDLLQTSGTNEQWSMAQSEFEEIIAFLERTVEAKNQQLDTEADRRVLVISDNAPFGKDFLLEAAREFFGEARENMSNIDEVFIEFRENNFVRVYSQMR